MRYALTDNIQVFLSTKGRQVLHTKNIILNTIIDNRVWFQIWELIMIFGKDTINLHNSNPIVSNDFF